MSNSLGIYDPDDIRNIIVDLKNRIESLEQAFVQINSLDEIADGIGELPIESYDEEGRLRMIISPVDLYDTYNLHTNVVWLDTDETTVVQYIDLATNLIATPPDMTGVVIGPVSAANGNLAAFDGVTGKLIKDSGIHALGGGGNIGLGQDALLNNEGGENIGIGTNTLKYSSGDDNTVVGNEALVGPAGSGNTAVGAGALGGIVGDNNIGIGLNAGNHETGDKKLFISSIAYTTEADGRNKSIIYGEMDEDPTLQMLAINANLVINGNSILQITTTTPTDQVIGKIFTYNTTDGKFYVWIYGQWIYLATGALTTDYMLLLENGNYLLLENSDQLILG